MSFKGVFKKVWSIVKVTAPIVGPVAAAFGIPFAGTIMNAIMAAEARGGSGPEKFITAADGLLIAAPLIIDQLERQLGVDIPDDAAVRYMEAQLQCHVDLMNAVKLLPKKSGEK